MIDLMYDFLIQKGALKKPYGPGPEQVRLMMQVSMLTGLDVIHDQRAAFRLMGIHCQNAKGIYASRSMLSESTGGKINLQRDMVILNTDADNRYWFHVLFHELAHATGAAAHLNRVGATTIKRTPVEYQFEELIADTVANRLMHHFGLATNETDFAHMGYSFDAQLKIHVLCQERGLAMPDAFTFRRQTNDAFEFIVSKWLTQNIFQNASSEAA